MSYNAAPKGIVSFSNADNSASLTEQPNKDQSNKNAPQPPKKGDILLQNARLAILTASESPFSRRLHFFDVLLPMPRLVPVAMEVCAATTILSSSTHGQRFLPPWQASWMSIFSVNHSPWSVLAVTMPRAAICAASKSCNSPSPTPCDGANWPLSLPIPLLVVLIPAHGTARCGLHAQ